MQRFIASIRAALKHENWFAALFLALAIPDVCAALEAPAAGVGDRYKNWFTRYLKRKYDPANLYELVSVAAPDALQGMSVAVIENLKTLPTNAECAFTAEDCYRFRCKCLHQGLSLDASGEKIHFTAPDKAGRVQLHMNSFNGVYQLQIDIFCLDICEAAERWLGDVSANPDVQRRLAELIEIHDLGDPRVKIVEYE